MAKADRALEHLEALHALSKGFEEPEKHEVSVKFEAEARCYVARVHFEDVVAPPMYLGVVLGDLVHNLRSALDQVAWQMARIEHSEEELMKVRSSIHFPVCHGHRNELLAHPLLSYVPADAIAVLDDAQPYNGVNGHDTHWLGVLNRLWNADKHRLVHPCFTLVDFGETSFEPRSIYVDDLGGTEVEIVLPPDGAVKSGTEVARIRFRDGPNPDAQHVRVKRQPPAHIAFGAAPDQVGKDELGTLCSNTALTISLAAPIFGL